MLEATTTTLLTLAAAASVAAAPVADAQPLPGVCARLAPQTGWKQQPAARGAAVASPWRVNLLGGLGATLFGGSTAATFRVEPVAGTSETQHLGDACRQEKADLVCTLSGPSAIVIGTKAGEARTVLSAGERAEVAMRGRHLVCRDL